MIIKHMFNAVDTHCGEPGRVITGGMPHIPGNSVYEKMLWMEKNIDEIRLLMLREPRGYPPANCNIIVPPCDPKAQAGYLILEQVEYVMMSGSNTISVATVLLETGMIPMKEPVTEIILEAPAGLIAIRAECKDGKVTNVKFKNVPAFAVYLDKEIEVPHLGRVTVDVAWGGMFYVIADVRQFKGLEISPRFGHEITRVGAMIRQAAIEQLPVSHPEYPGVGISISQLSGPTDNSGADWKNAVIVANSELDWDRPETWTGAIDRSPCGTGTCAKMATLHAKGKLPLNKPFRHEGILGTVFTGELLEETTIDKKPAVVPTISGQAWITGYNTLVVDATDPFPTGFTVGDIWA